MDAPELDGTRSSGSGGTAARAYVDLTVAAHGLVRCKSALPIDFDVGLAGRGRDREQTGKERQNRSSQVKQARLREAGMTDNGPDQ